ncbi:MAG: hypothetical protein Q3962_02470 [Corynebacterium sp.]|nr:hypothetical protein [Corynebacterium sp.]
MLWIYLLLTIGIGAAWGWFNTPYVVTVDSDQSLSIAAGSDSIEFQNFATYYIIVLLIGIVIGLYFVIRQKTSLTALIFSGFLSALACATVWFVGHWTGLAHYGVVDFNTLSAGTTVKVLPKFTVGATVVLVPALTMTLVWSSALSQLLTARTKEEQPEPAEWAGQSS